MGRKDNEFAKNHLLFNGFGGILLFKDDKYLGSILAKIESIV